MAQEYNDKKDSLNILIFDYLIKNRYSKAAEALKGELGLADIEITYTPPSLSTWYNIFLETSEVRSGNKFTPDALNRIEGIMHKLESEKQRFSRMKSVASVGSPVSKKEARTDPRPHQATEKFDSYFGQSKGSFPAPPSFPAPMILVEIKRIDLGISSIILSHFCYLNNFLITFSSDNRFYFYNLVTNEIEYDFLVQRRSLKGFKVREIGKTIYFAYSCDDFSINLCKYEFMKKEDIKIFDFEIPIKSFCLSNDAIYVLDDNSIKMFSFAGICMASVKISNVSYIEHFSANLLAVDSNKISEFDQRLSPEPKVITKGVYPTFRLKGEVGFITNNDTIQAIDPKNMSVVNSVKCALPIKDIALLHNTIAVCTSTDLFYATDVISLRNPIEISQFLCLNSKGMLVLSSDGIITLYSKIQ